jgi:hypothetical protein
MEPVFMTMMRDSGKAVRLPDWVGFWFMLTGGMILVLTKDGEIINTPDFKQYGEGEFELVNLTKELEAMFVKALRIRTDECLRICKSFPASRENSLAITSLQLGFMKMGKLLGDIGAPNPYPNSKDPNSPVIEKHADLWNGTKSTLFTDFGHMDLTSAVKGLRLEISTTISCLNWLMDNTGYARALVACDALDDAQMWLG